MSASVNGADVALPTRNRFARATEPEPHEECARDLAGIRRMRRSTKDAPAPGRMLEWLVAAILVILIVTASSLLASIWLPK